MIDRNYEGLFAEEMDALTDDEYLKYETDNAAELKRVRAELAEMRAEQASQDSTVAAALGDADDDVQFDSRSPEIR